MIYGELKDIKNYKGLNNNLDKGIFIEYIEAASNANKVAIFFTFIFIHTFS